MKAASREALANSQSRVDEILAGDKNVASAVQAGLDIFEVVDVLDADRQAHQIVADAAAGLGFGRVVRMGHAGGVGR